MPLTSTAAKLSDAQTGGARPAALCILLVVAAAFAPGLGNGYVGWDDREYIPDNPHLRDADGLRRIWTTLESPQYYPLAFTSHWVEYRLWGDDPRGYYVVNVALHALNALLVFALARALGASTLAAGLAGLLFGIHPVQVASVAWLAERKNVLSQAFALTAFLAYLRHRRTNRAAPYVAALGLFACALLSKTAVMTLPLSLWAADRLILRRRDWPGVWRIAPLLALAAGASAITFFAEHARPIEVPAAVTRPFSAATALWFYPAKIIAPIHLLALYPKWQIDPASLKWWLPIAGMLLVAAAAIWWRRRFNPITQWGACHFVIAIAPMLGLIPFGYLDFSPVADHFLYLAIVGPFIALGMWLGKLAQPGRAARRIALPLALAVVAALGLKTAAQVRIWRDATRLWSHTVAHNPRSPVAHNNLGLALEQAGDLDAALNHYQDAADLDPRDHKAHSNLANVFTQKGDLPRALRHAQKAVAIWPDFPQGRKNLGAILARLGRFAEAAVHYRRSVELVPDDVDAHYSLATLLGLQNRMREAIPHLAVVVHLRPDNAAARCDLGLALASQGRIAEALPHLRRALDLHPDWPQAQAALAWMLATWPDAKPDDIAEAADLARRISARSPTPNPVALDALAAAQAAAGEFDQALGTAQRALAAARSQGLASLVEEISARLALYRARRPFHARPRPNQP